MISVMPSLPLARVFHVCLHLSSFPLRADWRKFDSSVDGEPQGNWRWNSNSRDVVASSPSFSRRAARTPQRACSQAKKRIQALLETCKTDVGRVTHEKRKRTIPLKTSHSLNLDNQQSNWVVLAKIYDTHFFVVSTGTSGEARHSLVNWTHVEYLLWLGGSFGLWSFHSQL